jgi:hypothetical protein
MREYCICKILLNESDTTSELPMVGCDACDNFFHLKCLNLKKFPRTKKWVCPECKGKLASSNVILLSSQKYYNVLDGANAVSC